MIQSLLPVESSRFVAWKYVPDSCELYVRFPPNRNSATGKLYRYKQVAPEQWAEAQEAQSKGVWLGNEIVKRPDRHPFDFIDESNGLIPTIAADGQPAPAVVREAATAPKPEAATMADMELVHEAIREVRQVPPAPSLAIPEILPPDVKDDELALQKQKPFNQIIRERAIAIAAAVPEALSIASEAEFKALGAALVVVKTERKAVTEALDMVARPLIDAKRRLDAFRNTVSESYDGAEKRLDNALHLYRRQVEARAEAEAQSIRRQNQERAQREERERRSAEAKRVEEESNKRKEEAKIALQEAEARKATQPPPIVAEAAQGSLLTDSEPSYDDTIIEEAQHIMSEADAEVEAAHAHAAAPIQPMEVYTPPVVAATPDLKVAGLRRRAAKWVWEILPQALRIHGVDQSSDISRSHLKDPNLIPDEYWVLDKKAVDALVTRLKDRVSIPVIKAYDKNA